MRLDEGIAFEASVVAELRAVAGSDWVFVDVQAHGWAAPTSLGGIIGKERLVV